MATGTVPAGYACAGAGWATAGSAAARRLLHSRQPTSAITISINRIWRTGWENCGWDGTGIAGPPRVAARRAARARRPKPPLRDRARACETRLEALHRARERLTARLADPATYTDGGDIGALQQDLGALEVEIEKAEAYWLEAEAAIEALAAR